MNWSLLLKDVGRIIVSAGVVGTWLWCEVTHNSCADMLRPYATVILASWLGIEGLIKFVSGLQSGLYKKEGTE